MATNPSMFRLKCMPYELYANAFTGQYHLIKYLGMTADGRASRVRLLGRYNKQVEGKKALEIALRGGK